MDTSKLSSQVLDDLVVSSTTVEKNKIYNPNVGGCCGESPLESPIHVEELNLPIEYIYPTYRCGDPKMLSLISTDQMVDNKYPRVRALRRLIIEVVGPIVGEHSRVSHFGGTEDGGWATCEESIRVQVHNPYFLGRRMIGETIEASACADGLPINLHKDFNRFPTANADTRAKGRAYVGLLGLNINVAEELPSDDKFTKTTDIINDPTASNLDRQAMSSVFAKLAEIHKTTFDQERVVKFLNFNYHTLTKSQVSAINTKLQGWIRSPKTLPKELKL